MHTDKRQEEDNCRGRKYIFEIAEKSPQQDFEESSKRMSAVIILWCHSQSVKPSLTTAVINCHDSPVISSAVGGRCT